MNFCYCRHCHILFTMAVILVNASVCGAGGLNINIEVPSGNAAPQPPPVYYQAPPAQPVYYQAPPPVVASEPPPVVVFQQPPQLLYSAQLGYYVAVNTPYEMVFVDKTYYVHRNGYWFASSSYTGPFVAAQPQYLPVGLTRYRWADIRRYRDNEYRVYRRDPLHYQGRILDHRAVVEHRAMERGEHRSDVRAEERREVRKEFRVEERRDVRKEVRAEDRKIANNEKVKAEAKPSKGAVKKEEKKKEEKK